MTPEEFDIDFDFDKEYGYLQNSSNSGEEDDFDLDAALARELGPDFDALFEEEYAAAQAALNADLSLPASAPAEKPAGDLEQTRLFSSLTALDDSDDTMPEFDMDFDPDDLPDFSLDLPTDDEDLLPDEDERDLPPEDGEADIPDTADDDMEAIFAAAAAAAGAALSEEDPDDEEIPQAPGRSRREGGRGVQAPAWLSKIDLQAIGEKVNFQGIGEKFSDAGAAIADNAAKFVGALKAFRPGRMDKKQKRRFKNDALPVLIGGAAVIVCLVFIFGSLGRSLNSDERQQAALMESMAQAEQEEAAAAEIRNILNTASVQAAGYDYQAAINTLDSYKTADRELTDEMAAARAQYAAAMTDLVIWDDPAAIPNLSFHVLIADAERAYADTTYGATYRNKFVTTDQFSAILEQLYANGYVLVNLESCIAENTGADGKTTYSAKPIYLPSGKTPIMITETLVNYFKYMTDGNGDGAPDAGGAGFASKLVISGGEIKAEYIDAQGQTHTGNYDLVPILDSFISAHPDFSYQGARAILAVTGDEGVFGWRTTDDATLIDGAKDVVEVLRATGYQIASNSFANLHYGDNNVSVDQINQDMAQWAQHTAPVVGDVDIMVIAKGKSITTHGGGFDAMEEAGFHYIIDCTDAAGGELTDEYFHQHRIMVTAKGLEGDLYSTYFTLAQ